MIIVILVISWLIGSMTDTTVGGNGIIYNTLRGLFVCGIVYVLILCAMFLSAHGF